MDRSKIKALAILFFSGYLLASCFALNAKAEDITTGNLLPNAGDGQHYNSTQTDRVDLSKDDWNLKAGATLKYKTQTD